MPKIKYDKDEFKKKVTQLSEKHGVPEEVMETWLRETYEDIEKQYIAKIKEEAKKALERKG